MAKTDWKLTDTVGPDDLNQIGRAINDLAADNSVSDPKIGDRTISDATAPTGDKGKITVLFGWLANMIKSITGKPNWRTAPRTTLENAVKRDGDDVNGNLRMIGHGARVITRSSSETDSAVNGMVNENSAGIPQWYTGYVPSTGWWGVYDGPNKRFSLAVLPGSPLNGLLYLNHIVHHAGNHNNTGDPHSQYLLKTGGTITGHINTEGNITLNVRAPSGLSASRQIYFQYRDSAGALSSNNFLQVNTDGSLAYYKDGAGSTVYTNQNHAGSGDPHTQYLLKAGGTISGTLRVLGGIDQRLPENTWGANDLPSKYPTGMSIFFNNNTAGWPASTRYGTIVTFKGYNNTACTQYYYPYNSDDPIQYRYAFMNDAWTEWRTLLDSKNHGNTGNPHPQYALLASTPQVTVITGDLNAVTKAGMYRLQQTHVNGPSNVHYAYGNMLVLRAANADTITQIIFPYTGAGGIVFRSGNPTDVGGIGTWTPWRQMWNEANMGPGSGMNADLLDGYHASTSDTANTVVVRGANGRAATKQYETTNGTSAGGMTHYLLMNNGSVRFAAGLMNVETGSGATGSDYSLWRYNDDGSFGGLAFSISRSNGGAYFDNVLSASRFISRVGQGTAPLTVSSTTRVTNLNADMLDDCHATSAATPSTVAIRGPQGTLKAAAPQASDDVVTKGWFDSTVIQPTKPRTADLVQNGAASLTYYTLLDVTGAGILSRVVLTSSTPNYNLSIRITVDGVVSNLTPGGTIANSARGLQHYSGTGSYSAMYSMDFFTELVFFRSLKVEVVHSHSSTANLHASADYALK